MYGWLCLALAAAAFLAALARRLGAGDPAYKFFISVFIVGGLAAFFSATETQKFLNRWLSTWMPGSLAGQLIYFIGCFLGNIASFCVVSMMSYALYDGAVARRQTRVLLWGLIGCVVPMTVLLFTMRPSSPGDILIQLGRDWRMAVFQFLYTGYVAVVAVGFVVYCTRYLRAARRPRRLWISLSLEMAGASLAVCWGLDLDVRAVLNLLGIHGAFDNAAVAEILSATLFGCMTLGAVWLVWASAMLYRLERAWMWYVVRSLEPLWTLLQPTGRIYVLDRAHGVARYDVLRFRWRRIKVEITEFEARLSRFAHPRVGEWARQVAVRQRFSPRKTDALAVAATLRSAVDAWTAANSASDGKTGPAPSGFQAPSGPSLVRTITDEDPGRGILRRLGAPPALIQQVEDERALIRVSRRIRTRAVMRLAERAKREPAPVSADLLLP